MSCFLILVLYSFVSFVLGYSAYLGYLMMEHQHANLVLQCFCRLLLAEKLTHRREKGEISNSVEKLTLIEGKKGTFYLAFYYSQ